MTEWKSIPGFPDYEVSEHGAVRRIRTAGPSPAGRVLSGQRDALGRVRFHMRNQARARQMMFAHRLVAMAFLGPSDLLCCHRDGDCQNNHVSNLYYGTQTENMADRERHGRTPRGERNGCATITAATVLSIRRRFVKGDVQIRDLAEEIGLTATQVSAILRGKSWRNAGGPIFDTPRRGASRWHRYSVVEILPAP